MGYACEKAIENSDGSHGDGKSYDFFSGNDTDRNEFLIIANTHIK